MCASLTHDDPFDGRTASITGITLPLIYLKIILEIATPVDPIDAGSVAVDSLFQDASDSRPKFFGLPESEIISRCVWMYSCKKEGFICVDITHPC